MIMNFNHCVNEFMYMYITLYTDDTKKMNGIQSESERVGVYLFACQGECVSLCVRVCKQQTWPEIW